MLPNVHLQRETADRCVLCTVIDSLLEVDRCNMRFAAQAARCAGQTRARAHAHAWQRGNLDSAASGHSARVRAVNVKLKIYPPHARCCDR